MLNLARHLFPGASFRHIPISFSRNTSSWTAPAKPDIAKNTISVRWNIHLDPKRLKVYDFVNFSNLTWPCICWKPSKGRRVNIRFNYGVIDNVRQPFPAGAKGFLYWHHNPRLPNTTGEIRFRRMQRNSPEDFSSGTDLIGISGVPWSIKLLRIARDTKHWGLQKLVVQSKLIEKDVLEQMLDAFERDNTGSKETRAELYYLEQPFMLDLEQDMCYLRIVTPRLVRNFDFRTPFFDPKLLKSAYTGAYRQCHE
ncbi:hypothetical protein C0995_014232 [Termitomyces sp. Mi166|nr:hypothetical protein C0995_014232 [Termitomyces sp. Mi166\